MRDSLYRNSIFILSSIFVAAGAGFIFWVISARLYSPQEIGEATAVISAISLIASFSMLGLNNAFIRFAPSIKNKSSFINASILISLICAIVISIFFAAVSSIFSSKISFIAHDTLLLLTFIISVCLVAINAYTDSVFIAKRVASFLLIENIAMAVMKLVTPFAFTDYKFLGIVLAFNIGVIAALGVTYFGLKNQGYMLRTKPKADEITKYGKYAFGSYVSGIASSAPPMIIPIVALNQLGATKAAFFYIAFIIANFLFVVPASINRSLFAEGSHDILNLHTHLIKTAKLNARFLLFGLIFVVLFTKPVLQVFGSEYNVAHSATLILALSSIFIAVISTVGTLLNIVQKIRALITMNITIFAVVISCSYISARHGLANFAAGWTLGYALSALIALYYYFKYIKNEVQS